MIMESKGKKKIAKEVDVAAKQKRKSNGIKAFMAVKV